MQHKVLKVIIFFFLIIPGKIFSQTPESVHPKMDKYYPRPIVPKDTNRVITAPVMTTTPTSVGPTNPSVNNNTIAQPNPVVANPPAQTAPKTPEIAPAITSTSVNVEQSKALTTPQTTIKKPAPVVSTVPVPKVLPKTEPDEIYRDTRLGSSSPAYNTWEKNSDGAGSVTTNPKK